jgi:hypothetical protein
MKGLIPFGNTIADGGLEVDPIREPWRGCRAQRSKRGGLRLFTADQTAALPNFPSLRSRSASHRRSRRRRPL